MKERGPYKTNHLNEITEAALSEFREKGYERVTMVGIAKRARITPAAIYHYFASKDAILATLNHRLFEPVRVMLLRADAAEDALEGLRRFVHEYLTYWASHPRELEYRLAGMARLQRQSGLWREVNAQRAAMIGWYDDMLWRAMHEGTLLRHNPNPRATVLYYAVEGVVPQMLLVKPADVKKAVARIEQVCLEGVLVEAKPKHRPKLENVSALAAQVREIHRRQKARERERKKQEASPYRFPAR